jgi:hypothetical protein
LFIITCHYGDETRMVQKHERFAIFT